MARGSSRPADVLFQPVPPMTKHTRDSIRVGIIGMGNIGRYHADYLLKGDVPRCTLVAAASGNPATAERYPSLRKFADGDALIRSGEVDAVLTATPHHQPAPPGQLAVD